MLPRGRESHIGYDSRARLYIYIHGQNGKRVKMIDELNPRGCQEMPPPPPRAKGV